MIVHWKFYNGYYWHTFCLLAVFVSLFTGVVPGKLLTDEPTTPTNKPPKEIEKQQTRLGGDSSYCNCTSLFKCDLRGNNQGGTDSENDMEDDENGADLEVIDIRNGLGSSSSSSFSCSHYLEICCNHYQRTSKPKPSVAATKPPTSPSKMGVPHCGKRNINGVGFRIVGDIEGEAQMGEFPWMIAVTEFRKERQGTVYLCGGSLLHPRVILTAAHCVENKSTETLIIRAGEWDTHTEREDPYVHHDRNVDKIILHEDYTKRGVLRNDVALVVLSNDLPMTRHISPICLSADLDPPTGSRCFASGWGKNSYGREGGYQSILKKIDLPIVAQDTCQDKFRETRLGQKFLLHRSFVCAGGERGKDTCKGDGGSPLVCLLPNSNFYAQYGVVSWGLNCGDPVPGAYVNVPHFVPWIETKFSQLGFDSSTFQLPG